MSQSIETKSPHLLKDLTPEELARRLDNIFDYKADPRNGGISTRAQRELQSASVFTLGDLSRCYPDDTYRPSAITKKTYRGLREALIRHGIELPIIPLSPTPEEAVLLEAKRRPATVARRAVTVIWRNAEKQFMQALGDLLKNARFEEARRALPLAETVKEAAPLADILDESVKKFGGKVRDLMATIETFVAKDTQVTSPESPAPDSEE